MSFTDEIFELKQLGNQDVVGEVKEVYSDNMCNFSINIELRSVPAEYKNDLIDKIQEVSQKYSPEFIFDKENLNIFITIPSRTKSVRFHLLINAIYQSVRIKGDDNSFAIIKYFNGNFLSQETTCLYEDFIIPGNTIDISRLDSLLKGFTNKRTKI